MLLFFSRGIFVVMKNNYFDTLMRFVQDNDFFEKIKEHYEKLIEDSREECNTDKHISFKLSKKVDFNFSIKRDAFMIDIKYRNHDRYLISLSNAIQSHVRKNEVGWLRECITLIATNLISAYLFYYLTRH